MFKKQYKIITLKDQHTTIGLNRQGLQNILEGSNSAEDFIEIFTKSDLDEQRLLLDTMLLLQSEETFKAVEILVTKDVIQQQERRVRELSVA